MVPSSDGGTAAWMASHSRIYCDGAEHWVEEGDDEEIGFINRAQDEDQWLYVDDANGMVIRGKLWAKNPAIVRLPAGRIFTLHCAAYLSTPVVTLTLLTLFVLANGRSDRLCR